MDKYGIGMRISECARKKGITQRSLAETVGVSEVSISRYVNGNRTPRYYILKKIAEELGTTVEYLVLGNDANNVEMVNKHSFCDLVRDWMTQKIDPTIIRPEEMTNKMLYRSWVELWWMLDHYFEHDPPKWGDEKEAE